MFKDKGRRGFGGKRKEERNNKVSLKIDIKDEEGKDDMDIEMDFSPLMMNNNEQDEKSSAANFE